MVNEDSQSSATNHTNVQSLMESSMIQGIKEQKEKDQKYFTIITHEEEMLSN